MRSWTFCVASIGLLSGAAFAGDWPGFRGPYGTGLSDEKEALTEWGLDKNIKWKAKLPQPGNGSPIVVGQRVLVACAEDAEGRGRSLYCFDRTSGEQLWAKTVHFDKVLPTHETNLYCGSTPVSDGQRVVVWHASAGLHCYDLDGAELWSRDLGEFRHMWGYGSSPILHRGRVILHSGPGKRVVVTALDLESGETRWETEEPVNGDGEYNPAKQYMGSWTTPVVAKVNGADQIIVTLATRTNAYGPETGRLIWWCSGVSHDKGDLAYSSPVLAGDLCFVTAGFGGPAMAFKLGGSGDITESARLWRTERQPQSIGSGVHVDGYVYRPNAGPGTLECLDPQTGQIMWTARGAGSEYWGSIVSAGGVLMVTGRNGKTAVFRPNPERYEEVALNDLGESCNATPAISDGEVFIRTNENLVCIGE